NVWHQPNQLRRVDTRKRGIASVPADVHAEILSFVPTVLPQRRNKCAEIRLLLGVGRNTIHQDADPARRLRASGERPRRCAANQRDELAASDHSMTSSASASSDGDTVSPCIRAVWTFTTSWNFDGCTTGKSAGLAPFRIWPL